jgi:hypothetical protein
MLNVDAGSGRAKYVDERRNYDDNFLVRCFDEFLDLSYFDFALGSFLFGNRRRR